MPQPRGRKPDPHAAESAQLRRENERLQQRLQQAETIIEVQKNSQRVRQTLPETPPPQNVSSVEPYRALVSQLHKEGVEMTAIQQRLKERGYTGSYSAIRRFVGGLTTTQPEVFVRVECKPGEETQVDFGFAGLLYDPASGELRRAWAFVMTLAWSRHQYVEFVFDQKLATLRQAQGRLWLLCHRHAFEWLSGVPERVVVDRRSRESRHHQGLFRRPRGATSLSGVRRALRLPDCAVPPADAAAQGQGRARRGALREA